LTERTIDIITEALRSLEQMSARVSVYEKQIAKEIEQMPKEYLSNLLKIVRLYRESVTLTLLRTASDRAGRKL